MYFTLNDEHQLNVCKKTTFERKGREVVGDWRKVYSEVFCDLCSSSNGYMIRINKWRYERMTWHNITRNLGTRITYTILVIKHEMYWLGNPVILLVPELFFLILAHSVYKMWIIQDQNKLELWNKLHFKEKKNGEYTPSLKYSVPIFVE
jgi:hypothetical protein